MIESSDDMAGSLSNNIDDGKNFDLWLSEKLCGLNTDEEVFGPYIKSILEDEADDEEAEKGREEALAILLQDIITQEKERNQFQNQIFEKWRGRGGRGGGGGESVNGGAGTSATSNISESSAAASPSSSAPKLDLNQTLKSITESQSCAYAAKTAAAVANAAAKNSLPQPDSGIKAAIIAQYSQAVEEDEEDDDDEDDDGGGEASGGGNLVANTNSIDVAQAQLEQREKSRIAHQAKKDKDKEDREKQKKQQEDRKKKAQEKASKGERRR